MMKKFTVWLVAIAGFFAVTGSAGCAFPKDWNEPEFRVAYSPLWGASLRNTKDFDGEADLTLDPESGKVTGLHLKIRDNASDVNQSQVALMREYRDQMVEFNEQLKTHGKNLDMLAGRLNDLAGIAAGVLNVKAGPDGIQAGNALAPTPTPTPRPVETPADATP